jgi:elongation factor Ts
MAEITAAMVKALRDKTDAPMMECKKALSEAEGDMGKAEEILRVRLGNKASKAASKTAAEGVVAIALSEDGKIGVAVELNSQTDFVAKNEDFLGLGRAAAELVVANNPADVAALNALSVGTQTLDERRLDLVGKIGENMVIRRFFRLEAQGKISSYVHGGRIGVLVDVVGGDEALAKDIAMHIAASKPAALSAADVPAELVEKERTIAAQKAAESGKPANIIEKMVEGSVQKFLKEVSLLNQPFVKDPSVTIEALLKSKGASIAQYALVIVGEGIEKEEVDFAAEVAAQMAASQQ